MLEYIFYNENPKKECVVLLHGFGGNSRIFHKQLACYKEKYKVLAIHLPGHGNSWGVHELGGKLTMEFCAKEVDRVLNHLKIERAHFVGISLGTIIIHELMRLYPEKIQSAVLGGAITSFNFLAKTLYFYGNILKGITPHMWIYRFFAQVLMPKKNHAESRNIFIREALKMKRADFYAWYTLIFKAGKTYKGVFDTEVAKGIPKLYISGEEDHMFIHNITKDIQADRESTLYVLEKCGHVCNLEKASEFNLQSLAFMERVDMDR